MDAIKAALDVIGRPVVTGAQKRTADLGLRVDADGNFRSFGDYMHAKQRKLAEQNNANINGIKTSNIFKGLSFYVNGYTTPTSKEINEIVTANGGQYHHYQIPGLTTYTIAQELANTKVERLRKGEKVLKPAFILDSVRAGRLLPEADYFLLKPKDASTSAAGQAVMQFFNRSRLHLISTMATELKKFVADLRATAETHEFHSRKNLEHLKCDKRMDQSPAICHIDMDCFFVAVALRTRPDLVGKPVAVTHSSASNSAYGEIASCSYEARGKGCYARQLVRDALKLCPDLVCVPYQFDAYVAIAKQLYAIIARYTLRIKAVSCDELYFDVGAICDDLNINDVMAVIATIREEILTETGCVASAGIGPNWLLARLATKKAKPNGQFQVQQGDGVQFIKQFSISDLPTIGWSSTEAIRERFGQDVQTCAQLYHFPLDRLRTVLGASNGEKVYRALRGHCDELNFCEVVDQKSVSVNVNFGVRLKTMEDLTAMLTSISEELSQRMKQIDKVGRHMSLRLLIRKPDAPLEPAKYGAHGRVFAVNKSTTLKAPSMDSGIMLEGAVKLAQLLHPVITDIRGISLHMDKLVTNNFATACDARSKGTLWNFMKTADIAPSDLHTGSTVTKFVWAKPAITTRKPPDRPSTKDLAARLTNFDDMDESEEMALKISDIVKQTAARPVVPRRVLGHLPPPPKDELPAAYSNICMTRTQRLEVAGVVFKLARQPRKKDRQRLMFHLRRILNAPDVLTFKHFIEVLERHCRNRLTHRRWTLLLDECKRYFNWYCYNRHRHKLFRLCEQEDDERLFQQLVTDVVAEMSPRSRGQSPVVFYDSEDDVQLVEQPRRIGQQKLTVLRKRKFPGDKRHATTKETTRPATADDDDCVILEPEKCVEMVVID